MSSEMPTLLNSGTRNALRPSAVTKAISKKELKRTKEAIGCKTVCAKWIVGADLLFDKVRSQAFAIVSLTASVTRWFTIMLLVKRKHLSAMYFWIHYADCAGSESAEQTSFFRLDSLCDKTPLSGPVWELHTNILHLTLFLSFTCMANNPYRSKAWCLPAFIVTLTNAMAQVTIFVYALNGTNVLPQFFTDAQLRQYREDGFPETSKEDMVYGDWSLGVLWYETISLAFLTLLEFLLPLVVMGQDKENNHHRCMFKNYGAHVKGLLTHDKIEAKRSKRFQDISDALANACDEKQKPTCAVAALMSSTELDDDTQTVESRRSSCKTILARTRAMLCTAFHLCAFGQSEGEGVPPKIELGSQCFEGKRKRHGNAFHLPVLVWFAALFSVWLLGFNAVNLISFLTGQHQEIVPKARLARNNAKIGLETLEKTNVYLKEVNGQMQYLAAYHENLLQVQKSLGALERKLSQLHPLLQPVHPEMAAQVEDVIELVQVVKKPAAINIEELNTTRWLEWADVATTVVDEGTSAVRNLSDVVDHTSRKIETFSESIVLTGFVSIPTSAVVTLICTGAMLIGWVRSRQEIALGKKEADTKFIKEHYHPARAPQLPGLMAISALFGFFLLNSMFFIVVQIAYWLPQAIATDKDGFLEFLKTHSISIGTSLAVKVLILDQILGRRVLVSGEGFVVRWQAFTWYIVVMIPLSITSGAVLALIRFLSLLVICSCYVVRLDTTLFPNCLQVFDTGYVAFMASVILDHRHRNPIWTCLLEKLQLMHLKVMKDDSKRMEVLEDLDEDISEQHSQRRPSLLTASFKRMARKWQLARTLANNPQLIKERRRGK